MAWARAVGLAEQVLRGGGARGRADLQRHRARDLRAEVHDLVAQLPE